MDPAAARERLEAARRPLGGAARSLTLGGLRLRLEGLDDELAARLERRWGVFLGPAANGPVAATLTLADAGEAPWLEPQPPGGLYRLELAGSAGPGDRLVLSDHFALHRASREASRPHDGGAAAWRAAVTRGPEPLERVADNLCRIVSAALALDAGGLALHGAGVLLEGRAWLLAGKSRSGKTTAVSLMVPPGVSLGDDFAMLWPERGRWVAPAVPFDNSERIEQAPPPGTWPVAGVWRLFQAQRDRTDRPPPLVAEASVMACAAFPWLFPDRAAELMDRASRLVDCGLFGHLHFRREGDPWTQLRP